MTEFGSIDDGQRSRVRALVILLVVGVVLVAVVALLWRDLGGQTFGVSLDQELAAFPARQELILVGEVRTGTGTPFFGERPGRRGVYASTEDPATTSDVVEAALASWQVEARHLTAGTDEQQCALAGPRATRRLGAATHVRAVVYTPEGYAELMAPGSREWPAIDPLPGSVVVLQLTRVGAFDAGD